MSMKKDNFCTIQLKTATEKFVLKIENFSDLEKKCGEYLRSTEFISTAPNGQLLKWKLHIYPNGFKEEFKDYVSLFLNLIDSNNEEVEAKFQFSIRKHDGNEFILASDNKYKFTNSGFKGWGNDKLIKREDLLDEANGYLNGGHLTIVCTLMVQQKLVKKAPLPDIDVPECRGMEDLSHLYEQSLFPDCKIISKKDDKEYKVHKCILGCRSPVFKAMFEHEMMEKNNNEVNIEDMKGEVIEQMLQFIYSGKEPDMDEGMAEELLKAADKYELTRLKLLCERKLINSLENANVCGLLLLADQYSAEHLKTHSINFIKMHMKKILETDGWKLLLADEEVMEQVLKAMAK